MEHWWNDNEWGKPQYSVKLVPLPLRPL